ncbi:serine/threonine protein kinase [Bdellovibrio bacteriovorus]|uniref:serine/threonine protein kinase n=1 Tax=Bdellovibrio bacteriovorus TaxID=959 RepID=UPI0035A71E87
MNKRTRNVRIGSYEILRSLAKGGMAEIFLAKSISDHGIRKFVAIKKRLRSVNSEEMIQMFAEEMRIAACLNHRNIVQTFDFGSIDADTYLVMEYIQGVSLRELVACLRDRQELLDLQSVLYIIREVAEGLDYASNAQDPVTGLPLLLIHRDLSPHNIMLTFSGEVKIIDFGVAKAVTTQNTLHGVVKGKVAYMSPEQVHGSILDKRSDLFSLGIIFWELLTNLRFFSGENVDDVRKRVRSYRVQSLNFSESNRVDQVKKILFKMIHHDPHERYPNARELIKDISLIINTEYPQFSPRDVATLLKERYFAAKFSETLNEIASFSKSPESLALSDISRKEVRSVIMSPKPARTHELLPSMSDTGLQVVTENIPPLKLGTAFFGVVLTSCACLFISAVLRYRPEVTSTFKGISALNKKSQFSEQKVVITFVSQPSGATMLLNGRSYNLDRAQSIPLVVNRPYQIYVFKDLFVPQSFTFIPKQPVRHEVRLSSFPFIRVAEQQIKRQPAKRKIKQTYRKTKSM